MNLLLVMTTFKLKTQQNSCQPSMQQLALIKGRETEGL